MTAPFLTVSDLTVAYGDNVIMKDVSFTVNRGDVFIIMGASGCGKSTLLSVLTGLKEPFKGDVLFDGLPFWGEKSSVRSSLFSIGVAALEKALPSVVSPSIFLPFCKPSSFNSLKKSKFSVKNNPHTYIFYLTEPFFIA